ncbi:uncharacterized protein JN550_007822 [Neoarthrinium moseri]|uniref:uncharacterized protein n=1 Tax=Neoarthrinium moseri TaxID=1658444 RepID=UPI001FDE133B|nr:uncharacterized protein JN550_007822 [Neoarthrinium moseri]KAI1866133.1 hypothetical protein JN550_007822 [Neoarthrinium moseri]
MANTKHDLRPQATEYTPQKSTTAIAQSDPATAVPSPTQSPESVPGLSPEALLKTREPTAADTRGSFSTVDDSRVTTPQQLPPDASDAAIKAMPSPLATTENTPLEPEHARNDMEVKGVAELIHSHNGLEASTASANMARRAPLPTVYVTRPYTHGPIGTHVVYAPVAPQNLGGGVASYSGFMGPPAQPPVMLSAGADPISEGRRIYIGNLKYSADRQDVKKLLRIHNVNRTVEKIYMPFAESPSTSGGFASNESNAGDSLANKGYVFVTYTDPNEAEAALICLNGVVHLDRRLVCRPGLPKGTSFKQEENQRPRKRHSSQGFGRRRGSQWGSDGFDSYGYQGYGYGTGGGRGYYGYQGGNGGRRQVEPPRAFYGPAMVPYFDTNASLYAAGYGDIDYDTSDAPGTARQQYGLAKESFDSGYNSGAPTAWRGSGSHGGGNRYR